MTLVAALALLAAPVAAADHCPPPAEVRCDPNSSPPGCEELLVPPLNALGQAIYTACELLSDPR